MPSDGVSPQIVLFQRDASTGALSSATTTAISGETDVVSGIIAGFTTSTNTTSSTNKLFVSMADANNADGGIVVFNIEVRTNINGTRYVN